ncbi:MAG: Lrp/AsnC ligand binding domain-containing protein [Chloroflexi bacterium]|nr:Lrp/AsnC ligand binding domain-containing protein [Chloroflexota bacterium]
MELKEVLSQVPGLTKRFVYYLESQGFIKPVRVPKSRIARRDYRQEDLRLVQEVWRYYQRGYAVQRAYALATRPERTIAYVAFPAPVRRWRQVLEVLRGFREVVEAAPVYGDSWDILAKTDTPEASDIYHALAPALAEAGLPGMPSVWRAREYYSREGAPMPNADGLTAYILMKVPSKHIEGVVEELKAFPEVLEVSVIYGESDIIAKAHVINAQELDRLVMDKVHGLEPVESTRTFIVVSGLRWSR